MFGRKGQILRPSATRKESPGQSCSNEPRKMMHVVTSSNSRVDSLLAGVDSQS